MNIYEAEERRLKRLRRIDRAKRDEKLLLAPKTFFKMAKSLSWKLPLVGWLIGKEVVKVVIDRYLKGPLLPSWGFFFEVRHRVFDTIIKKVRFSFLFSFPFLFSVPLPFPFILSLFFLSLFG